MCRHCHVIMDWRLLIGMAVAPVCICCGAPLVRGERALCTACLASLPRRRPVENADGPVRERLAVRGIDIPYVLCWADYVHDSGLGRLMRRGKYNGQPRVYRELGRAMGADIRRRGSVPQVDVLLPVPMHRRRRWMRGYNQAEVLARALGDQWDIPVGDNLVARAGHVSQTRLRGAERIRALADKFALLRPRELTGLRIGLVDDILTTGGTLTAAIDTLKAARPASVSVITLALTPRE